MSGSSGSIAVPGDTSWDETISMGVIDDIQLPAREWLEPDGLGGFAMGTSDGVRTRRYHTILLVACEPPRSRMALVADLEVFVETAVGRFALSSHRYGEHGDVVYPDGVTRLHRFTHHPWPRWEWVLPDGTRIAHELVVQHAAAPNEAPRVAVRWTRLTGTATALHVQPLLAGRDYHATHHENAAFRFAPELAGDCVTWRPYAGVPAVHCAANGLYQHAPDWYRSFFYAEDAARGLDATEDLATPGVFTFDLAGDPAAMVFSTAWLPGDAAETCATIFTREAQRRGKFASPLARAADAYVVWAAASPTVATPSRTVIAGYPWFADWGRDTFISLRGLCLATGRRDDARSILCRWASGVSRGMLPNRFDEHTTEPEYNSVDGALWFIIAADAYLHSGDVAPGDLDLLHATITAIVDGYRAGSYHRVHADDDGLLACGEPNTQLTWMDARVDGVCVTPRIGKPVEVQALWFNALTIAGRTVDAERAKEAFLRRFWDPQRRQLHDVVDPDHVKGAVDPTCRPNQIFAIGGAPYPILEPTGEHALAVLETVERRLWTPAGLRSLSAGDPRYHPRYAGDQRDRDRAYHNGTTWAWLTGAFIEAWLRAHGDSPANRRAARERFFAPLVARTAIAGLDHLAEIADADAPHRAVGCPFQAWSMAEAIRIDQLLG